MTKPNLEVDGLPQATEGKRPWGTPQIIVSTLASEAGSAAPTSTPFADAHGGVTTAFGPFVS
jgi:hypothetical protein